MSLRIVDYKVRQNENGQEFFALLLEGEVEMVKSEASGRFYATARRTSIPSTFNETTCQQLIGKEIPGKIVKVDSEPYEYEIPESGEVIMLSHRWEYRQESNMEDHVFEREKSNGSAIELE